MPDEANEPQPDFMIPMTRLHLEPLPSVPAQRPLLPTTLPPAPQPPPVAIPLAQEHRGALALLLVGVAAGVGFCVAVMGAFVSMVLGGNVLGVLPGLLFALAGSGLAFGLAHADLRKMDRGVMAAGGRALAQRGRWLALVVSSFWLLVLYTLVVFQIGLIVGKRNAP